MGVVSAGVGDGGVNGGVVSWNERRNGRRQPDAWRGERRWRYDGSADMANMAAEKRRKRGGLMAGGVGRRRQAQAINV